MIEVKRITKKVHGKTFVIVNRIIIRIYVMTALAILVFSYDNVCCK